MNLQKDSLNRSSADNESWKSLNTSLADSNKGTTKHKANAASSRRIPVNKSDSTTIHPINTIEEIHAVHGTASIGPGMLAMDQPFIHQIPSASSDMVMSENKPPTMTRSRQSSSNGNQNHQMSNPKAEPASSSPVSSRNTSPIKTTFSSDSSTTRFTFKTADSSVDMLMYDDEILFCIIFPNGDATVVANVKRNREFHAEFPQVSEEEVLVEG